MRVLITGGTGTLGRELARQLSLERDYSKIIIYSRSESLQAEMMRTFPIYPANRFQYIIGDVRDLPKLTEAMQGVDCVIHAAALKRIEVGEYNIEEVIKTNVTGTMNVATACNRCGVKRAVLVSTDKAVSPINGYGVSKAMAERIFISANNLGSCRFTICRYGNVTGSKGSVIELWRKQLAEHKPLTLTNRDMTRFFIPVEEAARFVIKTLADGERGFIYVPKIKAHRMIDIAESLSDKIQMVPERPGEKLHEELIQRYENTYESAEYYAIAPHWHEWAAELPKVGEHRPGLNLTSERV